MFAPKLNGTGKVTALVDIEFLLTVDFSQNDFILESIEWTEDGVDEAEVFEPSRDVKRFSMIFNGLDGLPQGVLEYTFRLQRDPHTASFTRDFNLTPESMFQPVGSTPVSVSFIESGHRVEDMGYAKRPYLCMNGDTVFFEEKERNKSSSAYDYTVKLKTKYLFAQAFYVKDGQFSSAKPNVCPAADFLVQIIIVVGIVLVAASSLGLVACIVFKFDQRSKRSNYKQISDKKTKLQYI